MTRTSLRAAMLALSSLAVLSAAACERERKVFEIKVERPEGNEGIEIEGTRSDDRFNIEVEREP